MEYGESSVIMDGAPQMDSSSALIWAMLNQEQVKDQSTKMFLKACAPHLTFNKLFLDNYFGSTNNECTVVA